MPQGRFCTVLVICALGSAAAWEYPWGSSEPAPAPESDSEAAAKTGGVVKALMSPAVAYGKLWGKGYKGDAYKDWSREDIITRITNSSTYCRALRRAQCRMLLRIAATQCRFRDACVMCAVRARRRLTSCAFLPTPTRPSHPISLALALRSVRTECCGWRRCGHCGPG